MCNEIYEKLGPGYSERIYHNALEVLLRREKIPYETERIIPIVFEGHTIGNLRGDIVIDKKIIVELKAVKTLTPQNIIQAQNYISLTGIPTAVLVNFPQTSGVLGCEFETVGVPVTSGSSWGGVLPGPEHCDQSLVSNPVGQ